MSCQAGAEKSLYLPVYAVPVSLNTETDFEDGETTGLIGLWVVTVSSNDEKDVKTSWSQLSHFASRSWDHQIAVHAKYQLINMFRPSSVPDVLSSGRLSSWTTRVVLFSFNMHTKS